MAEYSNLANTLRAKLQRAVWADLHPVYHHPDLNTVIDTVQTNVWFSTGGRVYESMISERHSWA